MLVSPLFPGAYRHRCRRRALAWLACAVLAGCAGIGIPRAITLSEAELQAQLARRFPVQRSLLDRFDLQLSQPLLTLLPAQSRLATELTLSGSDRRSGRSLEGRLSLDYGLRFEPSDHSVRLVQPRVRGFDVIEAQGGRLGEMARALGPQLAERLLDDLVLYRVPAERIERLRAAGLRPGGLSVTPAGVEITIEPAVDAAP